MRRPAYVIQMRPSPAFSVRAVAAGSPVPDEIALLAGALPPGGEGLWDWAASTNGARGPARSGGPRELASGHVHCARGVAEAGQDSGGRRAATGPDTGAPPAA